MSHGCPVVASDIPVLKEVYGDSVAYCDPYDVTSIAAAMREVIRNDEWRNELKKRGSEQINKYSWQQSAKKVLEIIEKI
jgi:glycosyltransferase involved in cell wall biosynthesis